MTHDAHHVFHPAGQARTVGVSFGTLVLGGLAARSGGRRAVGAWIARLLRPKAAMPCHRDMSRLSERDRRELGLTTTGPSLVPQSHEVLTGLTLSALSGR